MKNGEEATITIESDQEVPFEFTLSGNQGANDGPLLLDCKVKVAHGVGTFITGSHENMDFYGFPPSYFTRYSRRVVVDIVDRHGEIVKHLTSNADRSIVLGFKDDATAQFGQRFFVRER